MNVIKRVFRKVQESLPDTRLSDELLVVTPLEHVLRAFMFEASMEDDTDYLLWSFVSPLYSPEKYLYLSESDGRANAQPFHITTKNIDEVAERALKVIKNGDLEYFRGLRGPDNFLQDVDSSRPINPGPYFSTRVDRALTHYMLGNIPECVRILEEAVAKNNFPYAPESIEIASFLEDLRTNPAKAARKIESWERENIKSLGISDTIVDADQKK